MQIKYFAYGSNMCTTRLSQRVSSCRPAGVARLAGYRLRFNKRSQDGSAKCNAFKTNASGDEMWGVLFDIDAKQIDALHTVEGRGKGYDDVVVNVTLESGATASVMTYVATAIDNTLPVYDWYRAFVVAGAREHGLPRGYVESEILSIVTVADPDQKRARSNSFLL